MSKTATKTNNGTKDEATKIKELKQAETAVSDAKDQPNPVDQARALLIAEEQARRQRYIDGHRALVDETGYDHVAEPYIENGLIKVRYFVTKVKEPSSK